MDHLDILIPLYLLIILGFFLVKLPQSLLGTADFLGRSALPFALLAVGASLQFGSIFNSKIAIALSSISRLILIPLVCWSLCLWLKIDADLAKIAIIYCAMPTAVSSYILARQMGGDAEGMAQIITFQTAAAAVTLPIFLIVVQQY